jgi:proteasome lid subunit RPN8/RPN11
MWLETRRKLIGVSTLVLKPDVLQELKELAFAKRQVEVCGFLVGRFNGSEANVEKNVWVKNISHTPDRFVLSPNECRQLFDEVQGKEELVGFFHSHRADPVPSAADMMSMRLLPLVWLILGGTGDDVFENLKHLAFKMPRRRIQSIECRIEGA